MSAQLSKPGVEIPKKLLDLISRDSEIQWFLYDMNLMPEQIHDSIQLMALSYFIAGWEANKHKVAQR